MSEVAKIQVIVPDRDPVRTIRVAGRAGKSAYEEAVAAGFVGTAQQWLASLKGEQGETGQNGTGDATYIHQQLAAAAVWTVVHNLNKKPSVTVVDSGDNVVHGDPHYVDLNSLTITFSAPFGGRAFLN